MNLQDRISNFIQEHRIWSLIIAIATLLAIFGLVTLGYLLYRDYRRSLPGAAWEEVDPVSGVTLLHINEDPEEPDHTLSLLGFQFLFDMGYTTYQYQITTTVLEQFFRENHPEYSRISYQKDSFHYESAPDPNYPNSEILIGVATLVSDDNTSYTLKLDASESILSVDLYLYDSTGELILYSSPESSS